MMRWRPLCSSDLSACLRIHPEVLGPASDLFDTAKAWNSLLAAPGFRGVAVEREDPPFQVTGFGTSVIVSEAFAERELASPQPGLNGRIVRGLLSRDHTVLSHSEIKDANSGLGLNVVVMCGRWDPDLTSDADIQDVKLQLERSFAALHTGYWMKRSIVELIGREDRDYADAGKLWRVVHEFGENGASRSGPLRRSYAVIEPVDVKSLAGSILGEMYQRRSRVLGLRDVDQQLLLAALDGATDAELAVSLNITDKAVKRRWAKVFARVEERRSDILGPQIAKDGRRGPQKRHRILSYVRQHPQELRPHRLGASGSP